MYRHAVCLWTQSVQHLWEELLTCHMWGTRGTWEVRLRLTMPAFTSTKPVQRSLRHGEKKYSSSRMGYWTPWFLVQAARTVWHTAQSSTCLTAEESGLSLLVRWMWVTVPCCLCGVWSAVTISCCRNFFRSSESSPQYYF